MTRIDFVTLFPEIVLGAIRHSVIERAEQSGILAFRAANPRDFAIDRHRTVDDSPYGGGAGMLMRAEEVALAIESLGMADAPDIVFCDPTGEPFRQSHARELASASRIVFVCGHYEGIDERVRVAFATRTHSVGDFVLTGGELPALVMADATARLIPGVLGSAQSLEQDSHSDGLLSAGQYTRPEVWRGNPVPATLLSGNHAEIALWRRREALRLTRRTRPDLFATAPITESDLKLLDESQA